MRWPEASTALEALCKLRPGNIAYRVNLGKLYSRIGRIEDAEKAFLQVSELAPERSLGSAARAQLFLDRNVRLDEAKSLALAAVDMEPIASNYYLLSAACAANSDRAAALEAIEKALDLAPGTPAFQQLQESLRARR